MKKIQRETEEWLLRHRSSLNVHQQRRTAARRRKYGVTTHQEIRRQLFGQRSKIISLLSKYATRALKSRKHEIKVPVPRRLSVIDGPEEAIDLVGAFARSVEDGDVIRKVIFDHGNLVEYDLAANALLDIVATELADQYTLRRSRRRLNSQGVWPRKPEVRRFIRAIGIIKHLDVKHEAPSAKEATALEVFDMRKKYYSPEKMGTLASKRDTATRKFVDHINKCLRKKGRVLTEEGRGRLTDYLGEILNNAEDHAGFSDWTLQGYLDGVSDTPFCEIAIFNFGNSIAETLQALPKSSYTWGQIAPYLNMHTGKAIFGPDWREADLLTVVALQPDVSSKNRTVDDTRGQGTVDLMQFFQTVYEECAGETSCGASMAILSGGTYIRFDGTHKLARHPETGRVQIAFNASNDLNTRPDGRYVRSLGELHFPGTIISIRFPLASATLVGEKIDGKGNEDQLR